MNQTPETEQQAASPINDDPNSWLIRVKLLFERSVLACSQIIDFSEKTLASKQFSEDDKLRFKMLPTEMIVAMHNVRVGIEDALLALAAAGLPTELREKVSDIFIDDKEEEITDLDLLFQRVVEKNAQEGFIPVAKVQITSDSGVTTEQYLGTLDFLKEMTGKYQRYDFDNFPKVMAGACRQKDTIANPFTDTDNPNDSCSHLENPQNEDAADIAQEEMIKYQKMCEELIEDANMIYGQFCAVGAIYMGAIQQ